MDFDDLMLQARKNEEKVKKRTVARPVNLEPSRPQKKLRADIVRKQEDEKRRQLAEQVRIGRQEREKLARMEAQMEETERRMKEENEKQTILEKMHKDAQDRKAKHEDELTKKRDTARLAAERKKEGEREKKRQEREAKSAPRESDIFKRRQDEVNARERQDERRKEHERAQRRRDEHRRRNRDIKMRVDAKKVAQLLSRQSNDNDVTERFKTPPRKKKRSLTRSSSFEAACGPLLDIQEAKHLQHLRAEEGRKAKLKDELRVKRAAEIESRGGSSTDDDAAPPTPHRRHKTSRSREHSTKSPGDAATGSKLSDLLSGNIDSDVLSKALNMFIRFPDNEDVEDISDAEYDSHDDHSKHGPGCDGAPKSTSQYSPLDSVFTETLTSETILYCSPKPSDLFKETLISETTYSPKSLHTDLLSPLSYTPSAIPTKYSPENFGVVNHVSYSPTNNLNETLDSISQELAEDISVCPTERYDTPENLLETTAENLLETTADHFTYSPIDIAKQASLDVTMDKPGYSPKSLDDQILDNFCYSPIKTEDLDRLQDSPVQDQGRFVSPENRTSPYREKSVEPEPKYSPKNITGVVQLVSYTPARPNLTSETVAAYMTPQNVEMTPHETEMNCDMGDSDSDEESVRDGSVKGDEPQIEDLPRSENAQNNEERYESDESSLENDEDVVNTSYETVDSKNSKEVEQQKLQDLFGNESCSEGSDKDPENKPPSKEASSGGQSDSSTSEEEPRNNATQQRRNKLKELARKKNKYDSEDSLSDYDHETRSVVHEEAKPAVKKPKSFEELMQIASQKADENQKTLEKTKQEEQSALRQKRDQEHKRMTTQKEMEKRKHERKIEREHELEQQFAEKSKNRIPKKHRSEEPEVESRVSTKSSPVKFVQHQDKRRKLAPPRRNEPVASSFEELMKVANKNSASSSFGAGIKRPEDVIRERKRKEIEKKRARFLTPSNKPNLHSPPPPPRTKHPPSSKHPPPSSKHPPPSSKHPPPSSKPPPHKHTRPDDKYERRMKEEETRRPGRKEDSRHERPERKEERRTERNDQRRPEKKRNPPKRKFHMNPYMDDDMDDFVVGDDEDVDYSKAIRNVFGYDKRKYRDEDDDCRDMETDYRTIQAEEARSVRLGKKEDAEELKKLQAEEARQRKRR